MTAELTLEVTIRVRDARSNAVDGLGLKIDVKG